MGKQVTVLAALNQNRLENDGADVENRYCETVKEARERAKFYLTETYRLVSEASERLGYSQVLVDGKVVYDYYRVD